MRKYITIPSKKTELFKGDLVYRLSDKTFYVSRGHFKKRLDVIPVELVCTSDKKIRSGDFVLVILKKF
jgi:hypothetical protein